VLRRHEPHPVGHADVLEQLRREAAGPGVQGEVDGRVEHVLTAAEHLGVAARVLVALDDRDVQAGSGQQRGGGQAAQTAADDDDVVAAHAGASAVQSQAMPA
jgi:hypothetical protein